MAPSISPALSPALSIPLSWRPKSSAILTIATMITCIFCSFDSDCVKRYSWVGKDYWTYSRKFEFNEKITDQAIYLDAEGIDTIADIMYVSMGPTHHHSVNDVTIGHVDNMYRRWWFDLRSIIKEGTNTITVKFDNSYEYASDQSW